MIIRIPASKDNTIVSSYNRGFRSQSWDANLGQSPYLQVYKKLDETSGSLFGDDIARSLVYFNLSPYHESMNYFGLSSSSINCSLKLFNLPHDETTPTSYDISIFPVSRSWDEGVGYDSMRFKDRGFSSWLSASSIASWSQTGSDYVATIEAVQHFDTGTENIDVDITNVWNYWLTSGNSGLIMKLSGTQETNDVNYYKKMFYSRHVDDSKYVPYIEVKVNDVVQDRRGSLILGKTGSIYLYNNIGGNLENLPCGSSSINVVLYDTVISESMSFSSSFTSSYVSTGIYRTNIFVPTSYTGSVLYDVWSSGSSQYLTGTVMLSSSTPYQTQKAPQLLILFDGLQDEYKTTDKARINFFIRNQRWELNTYYSNISDLPILIYENVVYEIEDYVNKYTHITASDFTKCSFDSTGHYFELPMSNFFPDNYYEIIIKIKRNNTYETYRNDWKFRSVK